MITPFIYLRLGDDGCRACELMKDIVWCVLAMRESVA